MEVEILAFNRNPQHIEEKTATITNIYKCLFNLMKHHQYICIFTPHYDAIDSAFVRRKLAHDSIFIRHTYYIKYTTYDGEVYSSAKYIKN